MIPTSEEGDLLLDLLRASEALQLAHGKALEAGLSRTAAGAFVAAERIADVVGMLVREVAERKRAEASTL